MYALCVAGEVVMTVLFSPDAVIVGVFSVYASCVVGEVVTTVFFLFFFYFISITKIRRIAKAEPLIAAIRIHPGFTEGFC